VFVSNSSPPQEKSAGDHGAGVALLDYDNDGFLDVYVVNGAAIPSLRKKDRSTESPLPQQP